MKEIRTTLKEIHIVLIYDKATEYPAREFYIENAKSKWDALNLVFEDETIKQDEDFSLYVEVKGEEYKTLIHHRPSLTEDKAISAYESYRMNEVKE